jgi:N-acetylglucosaminyl-diphospho-decaprenol L-rhamnosyltransferase
VVVPTYDSERWIAGLVAAGGATAGRCVVVDNGSSDGTLGAVRRLAPDVRIVETGANLGYGAAANRGAAEAPGAHVLVLNPDVEIGPEAVARLVATLEAEPQAGVVAPRLLDGDGSVQHSAFRFPSLGTFAGQMIGVRNVRSDQPAGADLVRPGWASGAALLVRRAAWDAVGGFDPAYFFFVEEVDFQRRLRDAGWGVLIDQRATAVHHGGARVIPAALFARSHDGWERYFGTRRGRAAQVAARLLLSGTAATRALGWLAVGLARPSRRAEARAWAAMFAGVLRISLAKAPGALRRPHQRY